MLPLLLLLVAGALAQDLTCPSGVTNPNTFYIIGASGGDSTVTLSQRGNIDGIMDSEGLNDFINNYNHSQPKLKSVHVLLVSVIARLYLWTPSHMLPPGCLREHGCRHDCGPGRRHERGGGGRQRQQGQRRLPLERPHAPRPHRAEQKVTSGTGPWADEMLASCYCPRKPSFK